MTESSRKKPSPTIVNRQDGAAHGRMTRDAGASLHSRLLRSSTKSLSPVRDTSSFRASSPEDVRQVARITTRSMTRSRLDDVTLLRKVNKVLEYEDKHTKATQKLPPPTKPGSKTTKPGKSELVVGKPLKETTGKKLHESTVKKSTAKLENGRREKKEDTGKTQDRKVSPTVKPSAVVKPSTPSKALDFSPIGRMGRGSRVEIDIPGVLVGTGKRSNPLRIPLRESPNGSACYHCPMGIEVCDCVEMKELIWRHLKGTGKSRVSGLRILNAKSILPNFVSRLIRLLKVSSSDVFWDLGSGHGSVVMQVALQTGADAIGVEIQRPNVELAEVAWPKIRAEWVKRYPDRKVGNVTFLAEDMIAVLRRSISPKDKTAPKAPTAVWAANLLFGSMLNYRMSEVLPQVPSLRGVATMTDVYPHERMLARLRNPVPYNRFPVMRNHLWQPGSVEWSETEVLPFYTYQEKEKKVKTETGQKEEQEEVL